MKSNSKLALLFVLPFSLASCGQTKAYKTHLEDYVYTMQFHEGFNILQLTDIHWNYNTSTSSSKRFLDKTIEQAHKHIVETQGEGRKIDLIELTGDQFMLANTYHVGTFIDYFEAQAEKYGFYYAVIWGNHDHHGLYNPNWLSKVFREAKHAIYFDEEDDLYGRSNFVIDLVKDGVVKWQIANLDSGASFSETAVSPFRDYDYIRTEQTDWWELEHQRAGVNVPSIAYYHIPQQENAAAYKAVQAGANYKNKFFKLEGFADNGTGNHNSDFLERASKQNLVAAFMGHAHNVDWTVDWPIGDRTVTIGLGVKTGPELYFAHVLANDTDKAVQQGYATISDQFAKEDFDLMGASLVTITGQGGDAMDDHASFTLEHLYLNERASGDFVKWVKY